MVDIAWIDELSSYFVCSIVETMVGVFGIRAQVLELCRSGSVIYSMLEDRAIR